MSGLKRVDEHKLQDLQQRAARNDPTLTEMDYLWLSVLEDRYALFLEEGVKLLKASQPVRAGQPTSPRSSNSSGAGAPTSPPAAGSPSNPAAKIGSFLGRVGGRIRSATLSGSGAASSPTGPQQQETARLCKHWSWVADYLILGGIPLADDTTDPSAHLIGLKEQCVARNKHVSLVVSTLEFDEAASEDLKGFAGPREWEEIMGTNTFVHIGLTSDLSAPVSTPIRDMMAVCAQIHDAIVHHGSCVYMHCKAGLSRCWVVAMCYLTSHRNMSIEEADGMLTVVRPQLRPTDEHREYVEEFVEFVSSQRAPKRSRDEDDAAYQRILADLLLLPVEYRERLVRDIEQLS